MKQQILVGVIIGLICSGSSYAQPTVPVPQTQDVQEEYARQVLTLINVASEIRAGHAETVAQNIERSLPQWLTQMTEFQ